METPASAPQPSFREIIDDALRYWETGRLLYNGMLVLVVVTQVFRNGISLHPDWHGFFVLFQLAVLANVCYTTAYVIDIPVQYSSYCDTWRRWRWILWYVGTLFAGTLAYFAMPGGI